MNDLLVDLFFVNIVVANLVLGARMAMNPNAVLKRFGIGLLCFGVAYAIWSAAAVVRPHDLESWVTAGVVPLLCGFLVLIASWVLEQPQRWRTPALVAAAVATVGFFVLRTAILPSHAFFSSEGLLFFNPDPLVKALYLALIAILGLPSIERAATHLGFANDGPMFKALFITVLLCSMILLANDNPIVLQIDGWVLSATYLVLWVRFGVLGLTPLPWRARRGAAAAG
jgi:hypothetical protein